ncbi:unnamed protein product, partial [Staurois parvus]
MLTRSCDQLCPITANRMHPSEGTCTLIIRAQKCQLSVSINASCQCSLMPPASAHQWHISAHLSCLSVSPISTSQCHLSMLVSATYQYCQSVPPVSATYQCASMPPISAHQCCLSVPPNS